MAFSGGVYTLPTPALVPGQTVSSSENNTVRNDMAASFNLTWLRNGTAAATANIPMGGYKLTGLGTATTNGDALSYGAAAVVTTLTSTSLTATRVPYAGTGGLLQDASTFTFDGTTLTAGGFTTSGAISAGTITVSGNITVSGGTANGVAYLNGSKVLTTGSALTFDGTNLNLNGYVKSGVTGTAGNLYVARSSDGNTIGGIQANGNDIVLLNAATGGAEIFSIQSTEQMRLTSTGLGIGTSSPTNQLDCYNSVAGTQIVRSSNSALRFVSTGGINYIQSGTAASGSSPAPLVFCNVGGSGELMRLDSSGNLGLGVTPSAWGSNFKSFELGNAGYGLTSAISSGYVYTVQNTYNNGTNWVYKSNGTASRSYAKSDGFIWDLAPSGTAGNTISFTQAMTLDASGRLGVGTTSPFGIIHATDGTSRIIIGTGGGSSGYNIYSSGGYQAFETNGQERMRIDSSGNVGIGTSSPVDLLEVNKSQNTATTIRASNTNAGSSAHTRLLLISDGGNIQVKAMSAANTTYGNADCGVINCDNMGGGLVFAHNDSVKMTLDSSGNLLVNTTVTASGAKRATKTTSGQLFDVFLNGSGTTIGYIGNTSDTATVYATSSDYRLKENIQPMQNALGVVAQLNPVTYTWKADGSDGQGFIAHELQDVVPDCVTGEKDAVDAEGNPVYQGIDTSFLVATLCKAIQELEARVKQLEGK